MKFQKWRVAPACPQAAERLMAAGYPYLVSAVLARRGISSAEEAAAAQSGSATDSGAASDASVSSAAG